LGRIDPSAKRLGSWAVSGRAIGHTPPPHSLPAPNRRRGWLREQLSPRCAQKGETA
jgi:hypothetical protein